MTSPVITLACELIARQSITPDDAGCQKIIAERLKKVGFATTALRYDTVDNLWAVCGNAKPLLAFAGHTDVVPPGDIAQWNTPPFEPTIQDNLLYGRGVADMKGSLAAMVIASESFVMDYPQHNGQIALLLTSDEEGTAINGTRKVMEYLHTQHIDINWCLIGEPSCEEHFGDIVKYGRRGSLSAQLTLSGIQGHVAYPERTVNPIHKIIPALKDLSEEQWDEGDAHFPPTRLQISNIKAGVGVHNVVPGELQVHFNFRYSPAVTATQLQERTMAIFAQHQLQPDIHWLPPSIPFLTTHGAFIDATLASIRKVTGHTPRLMTHGGTSDGRFIAPSGAEVVEFGPINGSIHAVNEHACIDDLEKLTAIYYEIMQRMLLESHPSPAERYS